MKILNIVKFYYPSMGGMETYVRQLCGGIRKKGIEASVLTINDVSGVSTGWEMIDSVPVRRVSCQVRLFSQPISLFFGQEMRKLIVESDLVHLHCPFPNAEMFSDFFANKPLVVTWCADPANTRWSKILPLFRPALIRVLKIARKIILIGPNLLENSPTLKPYEYKCDVIPLAYSSDMVPEAITPKSQISSNGGPKILFVGKLRKYKGVEYLIHALRFLPDARLRVVGKGEEAGNLKQLANKLGIADRITFLENIPNACLSEEYKNADLFVLPSVDASEAFGIVQAEAMSHGLPVINTKLPSSVPFVSLDGLTGVTVPPRDSSALAVAIEKLCKDSAFYENCSRNAVERAKLFSEETMIEKYAEVYRAYVGR